MLSPEEQQIVTSLMQIIADPSFNDQQKSEQANDILNGVDELESRVRILQNADQEGSPIRQTIKAGLARTYAVMHSSGDGIYQFPPKNGSYHSIFDIEELMRDNTAFNTTEVGAVGYNGAMTELGLLTKQQCSWHDYILGEVDIAVRAERGMAEAEMYGAGIRVFKDDPDTTLIFSRRESGSLLCRPAGHQDLNGTTIQSYQTDPTTGYMRYKNTA